MESIKITIFYVPEKSPKIEISVPGSMLEEEKIEKEKAALEAIAKRANETLDRLKREILLTDKLPCRAKEEESPCEKKRWSASF